jgi:hypothetical protein
MSLNIILSLVYRQGASPKTIRFRYSSARALYIDVVRGLSVKSSAQGRPLAWRYSAVKMCLDELSMSVRAFALKAFSVASDKEITLDSGRRLAA